MAEPERLGEILLLNEGQMLGGALLDAEARIGDLLSEIPDYHSQGRGTMKRKELPEGIGRNLYYQCQQLAEHRDGVFQAVKDYQNSRQIRRKRKEGSLVRTRPIKSTGACVAASGALL